jgi:hypothetical protein
MKSPVRQKAVVDTACSPVFAADDDEDHQLSSREKSSNGSVVTKTCEGDYTHRHKKFGLTFSRKRRLQQFEEDRTAVLTNVDEIHLTKKNGKHDLKF